MMIDEFSALIGRPITGMDYEVIERVYMWHPSFERTDAKKTAATLYNLLGVVPFLAMYADATKAMELEDTVTSAASALESAKQKREEFKALFR